MHKMKGDIKSQSRAGTAGATADSW